MGAIHRNQSLVVTFDSRSGSFGAYRDAQFWNYPLQRLLVHEDRINS
jgi:hypothetical protein